MLVPGDLGFPGLSLVFFFFFVPIVSFLIRQKWRNSVERKKEIMRLVAMASEEAARAELEAAAEYGVVFTVRQTQCAVCYCPTTTRCSRCKAVRYCSGKCQIIHWRQGHREECNPPSIDLQFTDPGSDFDQNAVSQELDEDYCRSLETEYNYARPVEKFNEEAVPIISSYVPKSLSDRYDDKLGSLGGEGTDISSESFSVSSLVDFSTSTTSESLSDVSSVSEVPVSNHPDNLEGPVLDDVGHEGHATTTSGSKSKQTMPSQTVEIIDCKPTSSPHSRIHISRDSKILNSCTTSSDFWKGTFDSNESGNDSHDSSQSSEETEDHLSGDAYPTTSGNKMSSFGASLTEEIDTSELRNLHSPSSERSDSVMKQKLTNSVSGTYNDNQSPSAGSRTEEIIRDTSELKNLQSPSSERSDSIMKQKVTNSVLRTYNDNQSPSTGKHTFSNVKSFVVDNVDRVPAGSSEISDSSPNASTGLKTSVRKVVHQFKVYKLSKHKTMELGNESAEKCNYKVLFPYEVFVKLYHWNKVELRPCGLINCGNSCYANAVLQCLAFTRPLTAYLLQGLHSKACSKKEWCFTCEFESLILKAKEGKSPLSPIGILSQLHSIGSHLGHGKEEDAHEFLRYAIETMQAVCLKEAGENAVGLLAEETTLIGMIFGGYLRSKIKCMKCHGNSERHERMMDLTVEIQGDIGTLEEALKQFTATEILDGENKYHCSRCKSYEKAKKKLTVLEAPNVLTIALKRFQSGKFGKLNKPVQFPEILNLAPYMSGTSDKSPIYRLYAVVVHLDIMNAAFSGHYVCYVSNMQGKWYKIDDSTVQPTELERVRSKEAYMLLYSRCSPRAPSLLKNKIFSEEIKANNIQCPEAIHSSYNGGNTTMSRARASSTLPNADPFTAQRRPEDYWKILDGAASFESFDSFDRRFHPLHRIPKVDSSSDNSSLLSCSDEGSCSTESTRDSTDDFSDYIFGEAGRHWNVPSRVAEDFDGFSSFAASRSSPSHSPVPDRYSSGFPETSGRPNHRGDKVVEAERGFKSKSQKGNDDGSLRDQGSQSFLCSDVSKQCRKLSNSCSRSSRETDTERLGWCNPLEVKHGVSQRRSARDRTDQSLY